MIDKLSSALQFQQQVISLREQRQQVLTNNIANADTPNYRAKDIDFSAQLQQASMQMSAPLGVAQTHQGHQSLPGSAAQNAPVQYRVASQNSLDGNTVDMDLERAEFLKNSLRYQADIQFIDDKISGLRKAMQPEQ
ncbi:Flagellar basal body rod protein FlgB [Pseudidiomarina piscicola]|uniref:Flagellar basal body rod protein FlgB n=1 Tax=Pseudidiomarina piscicola TaxID=2614830 RepID=A0A6S6WUT6_9GAMM|nr:flagellar basal body rod protein FlgB [Pseudidiomarina piscicola]CAB0151031.1 Flagellar basal body rod protein FlgB [Pseudidiomarina piscicola]VZT40542.1 Flagellar basal body rod protein FlgB [Pseudomonas aeruginosa]